MTSKTTDNYVFNFIYSFCNCHTQIQHVYRVRELYEDYYLNKNNNELGYKIYQSEHLFF